MAAARTAIDVRRARPATEAGDANPDKLESAMNDPELAFLRADCREEFQQALTEVLATLPPHEATMLKLHFLDGLSTATIAQLTDVSGRTARRALADIRTRIAEETRRRLSQRLSLSQSNLAGLGGSEFKATFPPSACRSGNVR